MESVWEDMIALKNRDACEFRPLAPARAHLGGDAWLQIDDLGLKKPLEVYLDADPYPLPATADRELYYGERHLDYWLSGLRDYINITRILESYGAPLRDVFELGAASGRVSRHFACQAQDVNVWCCDLNLRHVEWVNRFLPDSIVAFQSSALPTLPLEDNSVDVVMCFSVFTHIDTFELWWLAELRRILRPKGLAYITVNTEHTLASMDETWPLYRGLANHPDFRTEILSEPMTRDKLVFRYRSDISYSSNVILHSSYIQRVWARLFEIEELRRCFPLYQDVVLLRKPG